MMWALTRSLRLLAPHCTCGRSVRTILTTHRGVDRDWIAMIQKKYDLSPKALKRWMEREKFLQLRDNHRYIPERHQTLGPDLATASFIMAHDGEVKFKGQQNWLKREADGNIPLPRHFTPSMQLEAVDASGTTFMYESFENFALLHHLRYLSLARCQYVDDWCMDRLIMLRDTLTHLDVSGCPNLTERGLASLHKLKLQSLRMFDMPKLTHPELTVLMLEEAMPHCYIEANIDCSNPERQQLAPDDEVGPGISLPKEADYKEFPVRIYNEDLNWKNRKPHRSQND